MNFKTGPLLRRNLTYYWRTNLAVVLGVATAVAVLAGALLVGESVRASLRNLFLERLGRTDQIIVANGLFREQLAADIQNHKQFAANGFAATVPLIALEGTITHEPSGLLGSKIRVYGVDERFWTFHGRPNHPLESREILLSDSLAQELGSRAGDALLLRVQKYSDIPVESLYSKKEDLGRTLRLNMRESLSPSALGEFAVQPQQGATRAAFVPLKLLQSELEQEGKANLILVADGSKSDSGAPSLTTQLDRIVKESAALDDYGIKLRVLDTQKALSVGSAAGLIPETIAKSVSQASTEAGTLGPAESFSYLINTIRTDGGRAVPYSIVTGVSFETLELMQHDEYRHLPGCDATTLPQHLENSSTSHLPPIILNNWAGDDLAVRVGERVTLEYYVWLDQGKLVTRSTEFRVGCIIPMVGLAADRDLVPDYPGITESEHLSDWDPPFPIDLNRIRPKDEDYWKKYRTTPKAFIPIVLGQDLWPSRFGSLTSVRVYPGVSQTLAEARSAFEKSLLNKLEPAQAGFSIRPVRAEGLEASRGATDFGEYFLYFSFFLVVSALLLTALFFKLGIEQRLREIGILQAVGFPAARVRRLFLLEGIGLSIIGSVIGLVGALAYGQLMMTGLRSWWVDAVGTTMLRLHVSPLSLILGAAGGIVAALACIVWTLRRLGKHSTRSLLTGVITDTGTGRRGEGGTRERDGETGGKGDTETRGHGDAEMRRDPRVPASPCLRVVPRPLVS